jgi:hypothetical protein
VFCLDATSKVLVICVKQLCIVVLLSLAFGKAIFCLAKLGDELYIEAQTDGVRS